MENMIMNKQPNGKSDTENSIESIVKKTFPNCTREYISNLDEVNSAIRFCPDTKTIITIKIPQNRDYFLLINKFVYHENYHENEKNIFNGNIPSDEDLRPDFNFIEKILINYNLF